MRRTARDWSAPLGSSQLHNSSARGLGKGGGGAALDALFRDDDAPLIDAGTACETVDAPSLAAETTRAIRARRRPLVMSRSVPTSWRGRERWRDAGTLARGPYADVPFALSSDVTLTLREYVAYAEGNVADAPHYIVERAFDGPRRALLDDYAPPALFADDLLTQVPGVDDIPGSKKATYWFVGGARTGTFLHVDPFCTSAWNACVAGRKRWVMLAPETDLAAHGLAHFDAGKHPMAIGWFLDVLPRLRAAARAGELRMVECVQRKGDLVYVPAGWHHAVLNLEFTCAVGQNFITPAQLPDLWPRLSAGNYPFAMVLRDMLAHLRPDLAVELPPPSPPARASAPRATDGPHTRVSVSWRTIAPADRDHSPVGAGAAPPVAVLYLHPGWLCALARARPSAEEVMATSKTISLFEYHDEMAALSRLVRAHDALLCLINDASSAADKTTPPAAATAADATNDDDEIVAALAEHGLAVSARVPRADLVRWAAGRGARAWAVIDDDPRADAVARALATLASLSRVDARVTSAGGAALFVSRACAPGDVLLAVPPSACVRACNVAADGTDAAVLARVDDANGEVALTLALLALLARNDNAGKTKCGDARATYYRAVAPRARLFSSLVAGWRDGGDAARRLARSVAWARARAARAAAERERRDLADLGCAAAAACAPDREYLAAKLLLQTRAFRPDTASPPALLPLIDVAKSVSTGATAALEFADDGGARLRASYALDAGDEVTICYDESADFSDVFERFGCFDARAVIHTAEVFASPRALLIGDGGDGDDSDVAWRCALIDACARGGRDVLADGREAWWVPDHRLEACPLFAAVRATLADADELPTLPPPPSPGLDGGGDGGGNDDDDPRVARLKRPIHAERVARAVMRELLGAHLNALCESSTLAEDARALEADACDAEDELLALRFAHFEKALLSDALTALATADQGGDAQLLSYVVAGAKGRHLERSYFANA
jgi:histone arginine demethylase JMJD6